MIQAAQGATKNKKSFYRSKYNKLKFRLGSANKAKVAIANRLARVVYKILAGDSYKDLGYMRGNPNEDEIKKLLKKLRNLGVNVRYTNTEKIVSSKNVTVDDTGVVLTNQF